MAAGYLQARLYDFGGVELAPAGVNINQHELNDREKLDNQHLKEKRCISRKFFSFFLFTKRTIGSDFLDHYRKNKNYIIKVLRVSQMCETHANDGMTSVIPFLTVNDATERFSLLFGQRTGKDIKGFKCAEYHQNIAPLYGGLSCCVVDNCPFRVGQSQYITSLVRLFDRD